MIRLIEVERREEKWGIEDKTCFGQNRIRLLGKKENNDWKNVFRTVPEKENSDNTRKMYSGRFRKIKRRFRKAGSAAENLGGNAEVKGNFGRTNFKKEILREKVKKKKKEFVNRREGPHNIYTRP